jgi:hypothetical protein
MYSENRKTNRRPMSRIRRGPACGLLVQRCPRPTGHVGHDPLLCGLAAHSGGSGPRPRSGAARLLGGGDFTDTGGPATRSDWRRVWRSANGTVSSPGQRGRGMAVRRQTTRRSMAQLSGEKTAAKAERKRRRSALTWAKAMKCGQVAMGAWRAQTRAVGVAREARAASDIGDALQTRDAVSKYPCACASGQRCLRQPTRAHRGVTMPLTGGPHTSAFFQLQITPKSVTHAGKIARQEGKIWKNLWGRKSNLEHFS